MQKNKHIASSQDTAVTVRFPSKTHRKLKAEAKKNGRSFNTEVVFRLNQTLEESA